MKRLLITNAIILFFVFSSCFPVKGNNYRDSLKVTHWEIEDNSLWMTTSAGILRIEPYLNQTLHIQFGKREAITKAKSFTVLRSPDKVPFHITEIEFEIRLQTANYVVQIQKANSLISLYNSSGEILLKESSGLNRIVNAGETVADCFTLSPSEAIYGLGQFRDHVLNLRGQQRELVQVNTQAAVPVVLSTNGWGLFWDNPSRTIFNDDAKGMSFTSDVGEVVDFYLFTGNTLDSLIYAYRELTGMTPMLPQWALGLHQSKNKYGSQYEILNVVQRMKVEQIPVSSIFIDYYYWGKYGTGSHHFDEALFPNIKGMLDTLHEQYNTKAVITVWPTFKPGSDNYAEMKNSGFLLEGAKALDGTIYDAFNPEAAKLYWNQVNKGLMGLGIDGWFLDGSEPDQVNSFLKTTTHAGSATTVRNVYPLVHSTTFHNGLLSIHPNQRPYILTRCAWAGQQRNGTAIWSGDIPVDFNELSLQITAGLNFVASGIPYWTTDIGGYSGGNPTDPEYREVYTRWWQYGTFCPIFRTHGKRLPLNSHGNGSNELWSYGDTIQEICTQFDNLRYRLLPYIYSLTAKVTFDHYTPMRLLAFDFPEDKHVLNQKDEFMYGPAFLVCPVTIKGATSREVYLPAGTNWIDFWSGKTFKGSSSMLADAPLSRIPLFVKAGSILPMAPIEQNANKQTNAPVEVRIYPGADGSFELYEDDGESFDYKKNEFATILFQWDDANKTLKIGKRQGKYSEMEKNRTFHVVLIEENQENGINELNKYVNVTYSGKQISLKL